MSETGFPQTMAVCEMSAQHSLIRLIETVASVGFTF